MTTQKRIRVDHRRLCIGDLRERITLEDRDIAAPGTVDFDEKFTNPTVIPAAVKTLMGVEVFDESNTGTVATHDFFIRYQSGVTQEKWIKWRGDRYDILLPEEFEGRREWLRLRSTLRGPDTRAVNEA